MLRRGGGERRQAGLFRVCPDCGKRNFAGRTACTRCRRSLRDVAPSGSLAAAFGRREGDSLFDRRRSLFLHAALAVAVAAGAALVARSLLRAHLGDAATAATPLGESPGPPAVTDAPPIEREPSFAGASERRAFEEGRRLLAQGRARDAQRPLARAAAATPDDAMVSHLYGIALFRSGSRDRGLYQLEKAARTAPGVLTYRLELARALALAGRRGEAQRHYQAVLAMDPQNAAAQQAIAAASSAGPSVDLGGAAATSRPDRAAGPSFTNEDLRQYRSPAAPSPPPATAPRPASSPSAAPSPTAPPPPATPVPDEETPPAPSPSPWG